MTKPKIVCVPLSDQDTNISPLKVKQNGTKYGEANCPNILTTAM